MLIAKVFEAMLYDCVTSSPRACHYENAGPSPQQLPDSMRKLAKKQLCTEHRVSYLDTLMKTGSEIIEVITRRRRILFAGFVARMEDTRRSKSVLPGELIGSACCVRAQKKELRVAMPTSGQLQPRTRRNGARR